MFLAWMLSAERALEFSDLRFFFSFIHLNVLVQPKAMKHSTLSTYIYT